MAFSGQRVARAIGEILEVRQLLSTIVVNSAGDADGADGSSTLSLRQAIEIANGTLAIGSLSAAQAALVSGPLATPNTIDFDIPGTGPFVISPTSALPAISNAVVINGYSQPGAQPNTNGPGMAKNTVIQIELDGSQAGEGATGINLVTTGSTLEGLAIGGFGVGVSVGSIMGNLSDNLVEGDFIGTDASGTTALPNGEGITMDTGPYGAGGFNTVGGTTAGAGNVISGNTGTGLLVGDSCLVEGNFVGTDITGARALPNGLGILPAAFIEVFDSDYNTISATSDTIGGTAAGAGNVISGNISTGLSVAESQVQGNNIGVDVTGTVPLPNGYSNIGGTITSATVTGAGTSILGTLSAIPSGSFTINFYAHAAASSSGQVALGSTTVTTDASGNASFSFASSLDLQGQSISALVTDSDGNLYPVASNVTATLMTTTELITPGTVATLGRPTTFAAVVGAPSGGIPTGQVNFLEDGIVIGSAPLNASGVAVLITTSLSPGAHAITAAYAGDSNYGVSLSSAAPISVFAPHAFGGPSVTSVVAVGGNAVVITFNRGLLPGPAQDPSNDTIIGPGHQKITIESATYNPKTASVTLSFYQNLKPGQSYQLTINGQTGDRVVDVFGIPLNGQPHGRPGHDFAGKFKTAPAVKVVHPNGPKAKAVASGKKH